MTERNHSHKRRYKYEGVSLSRAISPRKRDSTSMSSEYLVLTDIASNLSTYVQNIQVSSSSSSSTLTSTSTSSSTSTSTSKRAFRPLVLTSRSKPGTIKDDAKLLLNLKEIGLVPKQEQDQAPVEQNSNKATTAMYETTISPSLSFEARRNNNNNNHKETSKPATMTTTTNGGFIQPDSSDSQHCDSENTFSLSCPSLSLKDDDNTAIPLLNKNTNTVPIEHKIRRPPMSFSLPSHSQSQTLSLSKAPPQLFSRPISKRSSLDVSDVAETMAENVMQSFITALEWRTKVWTLDLAKSLSSKFHKEAAKLKLDKEETQTPQGRNKGKLSSNSSSSSPSSSMSPSGKSKSSKSGLEKLREKFRKTQEARVIEALSQTSSSILVHDVRTTFFVLEQQLNTAPIAKKGGEEEKKEQHSFDEAQVFRPLKKRRTITNDLFPSSQGRVGEVGPTKYTLSHALNLDSRCSVSTSSEEKMSVSLQTPGVIDGTFVRNDDGDVMLVDVSISLDTDCLALCMEQKSRLVVRTAAEECIISPPAAASQYKSQNPVKRIASSYANVHVQEREPCNSRAMSADEGLHHRQSSEEYDCSPFTPQSSHATPHCAMWDNALVTPNDRDGSLSDDSEGMPPPPPRLPLDGSGSMSLLDVRTSFLNPRRVSPTADSNATMKNGPSNLNSNDVLLNSPTPSKVTILAPSAVKGSAPPLVSPHPTFQNDQKSLFLDGDGPLLPVLLEAASAVHTMCN